MGLPTINIVFQGKGNTAVKRSARGIVACILKDNAVTGVQLKIYKSITEVDFTSYTEDQYDFLKLIYAGSPYRVIVVKIPQAADYTTAFLKLRDLKWNYLTIPEIAEADIALISAWIKEQRDRVKKTFKAVLPCCVADHEGIINFTTGQIASALTKKTHTIAQYCARIAGVLAGLSLDRSSTYYVLDDIISADVPNDPNERIDNGELIIVFDSTKYKIGRGVNSFTSVTEKKGKDIKKIKIIEGMDLYQEDIRSTFEDYYVGKMINDYDNKQSFVAAVASYHKGLLGDVLDRSFDNTASVNIKAQREYLESQGIDTSDMDDVAVAKANTGSAVFLASHVKFVDAMEDMSLEVNM
jgi:hypothetical protein